MAYHCYCFEGSWDIVFGMGTMDTVAVVWWRKMGRDAVLSRVVGDADFMYTHVRYLPLTVHVHVHCTLTYGYMACCASAHL